MTSSSSSPAADSTPAPESPQAPLATASEPRASGSNKVDYDPTDNFTTRWRNIFAILSGRMSDEGREKYRIAKDDRNEEADCKSGYIQFIVAELTFKKKGSMIVFLRQSLNKLGGDLNSTNIRCRRCHVRQAGGFDPNYGILICANEMINRSHIEDTLAHEMMHAYDHLRFKMDWKNNLRHAACTEVGSTTALLVITSDLSV
ncbi:MAG: Mitochondrial inner membrane protease atp23 [Cirrosporium novae-zelandiae]|nr:MAG: Mitochondrial inner membrane protease atp23 [Cirrosporium novae-zelandiae]